MRQLRSGFTLLELMMTVAIIAILVTIGVLNYNSSIRKSAEALTKGNLGSLRSALSIYYSDNDGNYPVDNLASLSNSDKYFLILPITRIAPYHQESALVTTEVSVSESGSWSYNNSDSDLAWGSLAIGCLHQDSRGQIWSTY